MTEKDLADIEARAAAATSGPWTSEYHHQWFLDRGAHLDGIPFDAFANDAEFCAAAREDVPRLCAELRRARYLLDALVGLAIADGWQNGAIPEAQEFLRGDK